MLDRLGQLALEIKYVPFSPISLHSNYKNNITQCFLE